MKRRPERGFTLIELMVALVVSSLLVGMILAIFSRMSLSYRGQQQIAGVQQVLAAARTTIELDAKQAGFAMSQGFRFARDQPPSLDKKVVVRSPVRVVNSAVGPDQIAFFYADPTTQAVVTLVVGDWKVTPTVKVDSTEGFAPGDLVVLSTADPSMAPINPPQDANFVAYDACVMQIAPGGVVGVKGGSLTFSQLLPWGLPDSRHCTPPTAVLAPPPPVTQQATMIYKFVARGYRIDPDPDPARAAIGALQGSFTGGLFGTAADNWTDLAYGFTDIQTALQAYEGEADLNDTLDPDADPTRDWYSGDMQDTVTTSTTMPVPPVPPVPVLVPPASLLQMSISLVARTDRDVEGIATAATPQLVDPAAPDNNPIGDHPSVVLPWAIDPTLPGRIYRSTTFQVDFRNLGVGR